jgi:DNA helicase-2/ATP-dependent DNA helicase PcrA
VELNKSYRSTWEIITFARRIRNIGPLEAVERHGDLPEVISCGCRQEELARIKQKIDSFQDSENVTLGIILKTGSAARALYNVLSQSYTVNLISPESSTFVNGISITTIKMSKGLEFDEVIIPGADSGTYFSEYDRSLLYIACTRAMHRLTLTCTGRLTSLISE